MERSRNIMYDTPSLRWERVPTTVPHVWIEHFTIRDREVLIVNDELGGFDMDTQSESAQYSLIEKTFPELWNRGYKNGGGLEIPGGINAYTTGMTV